MFCGEHTSKAAAHPDRSWGRSPPAFLPTVFVHYLRSCSLAPACVLVNTGKREKAARARCLRQRALPAKRTRWDSDSPWVGSCLGSCGLPHRSPHNMPRCGGELRTRRRRAGVDTHCFRWPSFSSPFPWRTTLPPPLGTLSLRSLSSRAEPLTHTWIQPCLKLLYL